MLACGKYDRVLKNLTAYSAYVARIYLSIHFIKQKIIIDVIIMAYLSRWEREYIVSGVNEDFRADGRCCKDYRNFTLETGVVSNTSGSARIKLVSINSWRIFFYTHTS